MFWFSVLYHFRSAIDSPARLRLRHAANVFMQILFGLFERTFCLRWSSFIISVLSIHFPSLFTWHNALGCCWVVSWTNPCDKAVRRKGAREISRETKRRKQDERNVVTRCSSELMMKQMIQNKKSKSLNPKGGNGANAFHLVGRVSWK